MRAGSLPWTTSALLVAALAGCGGYAAGTAAAPAATTSSSAVPTGTSPRATRPTTKPSSTARVTATPKPRPTTTKATVKPTPTPRRTTAAAARDVVWIRTPVLTHEKDFHDLTPYLNPAVGRNWVSPANYRDGDITIRIEIVGAHQPKAVPIYYLVGWTAGAGKGYIRGGEMFPKASGVLQERVPVKEWQRVVNGVDAGNVGNQWDWRHAFGQVNGDTWAANRGGELYPLKVRVTVTLHPRR